MKLSLPIYAIASAGLCAQSITTVGVDEETNDAWRTTDVEKPFVDADNIYGTDGYFIAQYPNGDPNNLSQPLYAEIALVGGRGYEGVGAEPHQSRFDDVTAAGPGPVADLVAGDYWSNSGATGTLDDFFTITLTEAARFRLGVITDVTPDNPPGLLWEAARGVQVTGPGGVESEVVDAVGPGEEWRDADVDYVLFDITGEAGDVFTVWGEQDERWSANALGGVFFDPVPNLAGPEITSFDATPDQLDTPGQAVMFAWQVEMPLDSLVLTPGDIDLLPSTDESGAGEFTLDPGPEETTTYRLVATRNGESSERLARVVMVAPEILSFTAETTNVPPGEAVTLSWEVTLPVTGLVLMPGEVDVLPDTDENGIGSVTLDPGPEETTTYQLVASRGPGSTATADTRISVVAPGSGITVVGIDEETNDAWRSSDIEKPFGDEDNIYGTDGYFIAQFPNGDPRNLEEPPYATIELVAGKLYEGVGAEVHQAAFDDVTQTGPGDVPDLVCGDYWQNSGPTGTEDDFFTITLTEDASFRLGVITDTTPDNPPGLLWEASKSIRITSSNGADTGLIDAVGPNEEWRDADVDYVLFDIKGTAGEVFTVWGEQDARWQANALGGVFFDPPARGGPRITDVSHDSASDMLSISWESKGGMLYNLRSEIDLSIDPATWPIFDGNEEIAATPPENTLTIPFPAEPERFFVVEEFPAPPETVFSDDFESGLGDWIAGSEGAEGTAWELGVPANVGPDAANSPINCFGTNLFADYGLDANVWLRSPPIDLTTAGSATLSYFQFTDIEEGFDFGRVSVLDAGDNSELAVIEDTVDGVTADWEKVTRRIPEDALGKPVVIEFRLVSDDIQNFAGWYLDDVEVTVP